jgi:hypothetical protein
MRSKVLFVKSLGRWPFVIPGRLDSKVVVREVRDDVWWMEVVLVLAVLNVPILLTGSK